MHCNSNPFQLFRLGSGGWGLCGHVGVLPCVAVAFVMLQAGSSIDDARPGFANSPPEWLQWHHLRLALGRGTFFARNAALLLIPNPFLAPLLLLAGRRLRRSRAFSSTCGRSRGMGSPRTSTRCTAWAACRRVSRGCAPSTEGLSCCSAPSRRWVWV